MLIRLRLTKFHDSPIINVLFLEQNCLKFLSSVLGEICPSHCKKDGEYVEKFLCEGAGFCCGNANNIYCCVDYWDKYGNFTQIREAQYSEP